MNITYWDRSTKGNIQTISEQRDIKVGHFTDCIVTGLSTHYPLPLIQTGNELLLPTIERFMSLDRGTIYEEDMIWDGKDITPKKVEYTPVFYFIYNCANYFHWIYDTVPYLYTYFEQKKVIKNLKLLIGVPEGRDDLYPFVYETLSLLGIYKDDLILVDKDTLYKHIVIGSSLTHNRQSLDPPHPGLFSIIDRMVGTPSQDKNIYISRRTWTQPNCKNIGTDYTMKRRCVNEDDVVKLVQKYNFKEVFCENLSMKEKIGLFRSAKLVTGPIGGGLCNVIFCKPETTVLSINSPEFFDVNKRLEYALTHTRLHHFNDTYFTEKGESIVTGDSALSISGGINSPWEVDLHSLEMHIKKYS